MGIHVGKAWVFPLTLKLPFLLLLKTGTGPVTSGYPHRAFESKLGLEDKASSRSISAAGSALVHPKCFVLLCGPQAAELLLKGEEKSVRCQEVLPRPAGLCPTVHTPCLPRPCASGCCICMKAPSLWAGCGSPLTVSGLSVWVQAVFQYCISRRVPPQPGVSLPLGTCPVQPYRVHHENPHTSQSPPRW